MFKKDLQFAFRNIWKNKSYSAISIFGLAVGMAVSFVILNYILTEFNYEKPLNGISNIYSIYWSDADKESYYATSPNIFAKIFRENYSSIAECGQISDAYSPEKIRIIWKDKQHRLQDIYYAEPEALHILPIDLIRGDKNTFEQTINSVYISQDLHQRVFNGEDMVGKQIVIRTENKDENFVVAGIFKNRPGNSHFQPEIIHSVKYYLSLIPPYFLENEWGMNSFSTYFKLKEGKTKQQILDAIKSIQKNHMPDYRQGDVFGLISLNDLHLYSSHIIGIFGKRGSIAKVNIFSAIAFLILLIACINFINISTARSSLRDKEYGIKKVLGAGRMHLFYQSLLESVLFAFISLPIALIFIEFIKPVMREILDREIIIYSAKNIEYLIYIIMITALVGILSGLYNAFNALKNFSSRSFASQNRVISSNSLFRRVLISFQFVVFIGLLVGGIIINRQMNYMMNSDLGYNKENFIIIDVPSEDQMNKVAAFINELKQEPAIKNSSVASSLPPSIGNTLQSNFTIPSAPDDGFDSQFITCDENYAATIGLKLLKGSFFTSSSSDNDVVLNELAAKKLGEGDPINKQIVINEQSRNVIGVVKNFFALSFDKEAQPIVFLKSQSFCLNIAVRYKDGMITEAIQTVQNKWDSFFPNTNMKMSFSDDEVQKTYESDLRFSDTIYFFIVVSIILSMIGLASMTAITTARRRKEIGVRKVLGASIKDILVMLSKEITVISLISSVIAVAAVFLVIKDWLDAYVYKIEISWLYPFAAFVFGLTISLIIVVLQSMRTASANPVDSLRYE